MFQHYKSEERAGSVVAYNQLLNRLEAWSQTIDCEGYYIWPQEEHELVDHLPLKDYLADEKQRKILEERIGNRSFQIGKLWFATEKLETIEEKSCQALQELAPLYVALHEEKNFFD